MADFDFSELDKLAADLGEVPKHAGKFIRKAVEVTARNVKESWRKPLQGSVTLPQGAASISYDLKGSEAIRGSEISAEIGPELVGQGPLVGMLEYGTITSGPTGYGHQALLENEQDFVDGLGKALGDAMEASDL